MFKQLLPRDYFSEDPGEPPSQLQYGEQIDKPYNYHIELFYQSLQKRRRPDRSKERLKLGKTSSFFPKDLSLNKVTNSKIICIYMRSLSDYFTCSSDTFVNC